MSSAGTSPESVDIVFADMDGTFLTTSKQVPELNMRALDVLAERRIPFVPCTGRPVSAVPDAIMAHEATRYVVGANGTVIFDVKQARLLCVRALDKRAVLNLYERVRLLPTTFDVFADGEVLSPRERYEAMGSYGIDPPTLEMLRRVRQPVDLSVPQIVERATNVEKVTCFWGTDEACNGIERAVATIPELSIAQGHPRDFEFQSAGVSKGSALVWLCDYLGLSTRHAVAFGDEGNDVPLVAAAGHGVAMANATEAVRNAADDIAPTNDLAGVGAYLFELLESN